MHDFEKHNLFANCLLRIFPPFSILTDIEISIFLTDSTFIQTYQTSNRVE